MFRLQAAGEYSEFPPVPMTVELVGTSSIKNYISDALETQWSYGNDKKISKSSVKSLAKKNLYFISNVIAIIVSNFYFTFSDKWITSIVLHNLFLSISQTLWGSDIILDYKNINHLVYIQLSHWYTHFLDVKPCLRQNLRKAMRSYELLRAILTPLHCLSRHASQLTMV